jgi:hypothetical protein
MPVAAFSARSKWIRLLEVLAGDAAAASPDVGKTLRLRRSTANRKFSKKLPLADYARIFSTGTPRRQRSQEAASL